MYKEKVFPRVCHNFINLLWNNNKNNCGKHTQKLFICHCFLSFIASVFRGNSFACLCINIMNETEQKNIYIFFLKWYHDMYILYMKANHTQKKLQMLLVIILSTVLFHYAFSFLLFFGGVVCSCITKNQNQQQPNTKYNIKKSPTATKHQHGYRNIYEQKNNRKNLFLQYDSVINTYIC